MNFSRHYCLSFFVWICVIQEAWSQPQDFYIATTGSDQNNGRRAAADKPGSGPFKTFDRLLRELEQFNKTGKKGAITVFIRGGTYTLDHAIIVGEIHQPQRSPIVFKNYPGEEVMLTGGKQVQHFRKIADQAILSRIPSIARNKVISFQLDENKISHAGQITNRGRPAMELFYNHQRLEPARWPNEEWTKIKEVPQSGALVFAGELPHMRFNIPVGRHYGRFQYDGDRPKNWKDIEHITLHGYWTWDWFDEFLAVDRIDTATGEIFIRPPHSQYGYCKNQRYYALNVLEELDQPGEWYLDHQNQAVYFWPPSSTAPATTYVSVTDSPLVILRNTENVRFEQIRFSISRGTAVSIEQGHNNTIAGCSFDNLGDVAVKIDGGTQNGIVASDIHDVAASGILLKGGDRKNLTPAGNYVKNTHIYRSSQWIRTYQPPVIISGVGNTVTHNLIHDVPGAGILLNGNEHLIAYNDLYRLALETGDVGGFYMGRDWTERGNKILYNFFHDMNGPGVHDVNAVYLDDWASGTTVMGNIFSDCARGIMIGGGRDNVVDNNYFFNCRIGIHVDSRGIGWAKYYFNGTTNTLFDRMEAMSFKNPPYAIKYPTLLKLYADEPAKAKYNRIRNNIFYKGKWLDLHDQLNLSDIDVSNNFVHDDNTGVYKNAKDHVGTGNPGIADPLRKDFRLQPGFAPKGIHAIPLEKIGLQADQFRPNPIRSFKVD